ncbi:MAG TPA: STAS domain-containing protein [Terracidiphilus sp.]
MLTDGPLTTSLRQGKDASTAIYTLTGPLTLRNMFEFQNELRGAESPALTIFDMSGVPYMDSAGIGLIMNHYVHCQTRGGRLVVAGASPRVLDVFKVTRVDTVLKVAASVEEAEA